MQGTCIAWSVIVIGLERNRAHRLALPVLRTLVVSATILAGLLAGTTVDRFVVAFPAWRKLGVKAWADYSRHADLGNGTILYSVFAIGCVATALGAAALVRHREPRRFRVAVYITAAVATAGLLLTLKAAPYMLSLTGLGDDPVALERAFDGFFMWSAARGVLQVLAFPLGLWATVAVFRIT
jgi:hypothetical protein